MNQPHRLLIEVPKPLAARFKARCALEGTNMSEVIRAQIAAWCDEMEREAEQCRKEELYAQHNK